MSDDGPPPFTPEPEDRIRALVREEIAADKAAEKAARDKLHLKIMESHRLKFSETGLMEYRPELSTREWIDQVFNTWRR